MKPRVMKVYYAFGKRRDHTSKIPFIRLMGAWLRKAGFEVGDTCVIEQINQGKLTVEKSYGDRRADIGESDGSGCNGKSEVSVDDCQVRSPHPAIPADPTNVISPVTREQK